MKIMANQYVIGQTIDKALKSKTASDVFSYDMLGEGSRTETDSDISTRTKMQSKE